MVGWLVSVCLMPLSIIFQYIVAVSFIGGGNHRPVASHWTNYHIMLYPVHLTMDGVRTHDINDYTGSCKSNYHTITTKRTPLMNVK